MAIKFFKYHGAGNDFIMIDSRDLDDSLFTEKMVAMLCNRHLGIGADGLILLMNDDKVDFRMKYFNSDGLEGTMCGNGGRCITAFSRRLGIIKDKAIFTGIDGLHKSYINEEGIVNLKMIDVNDIKVLSDGYLIDTGSMHFVTFRSDIHSLDVYKEGKEIRHQARFGVKGTNVNFVHLISENEFKMRTYERGVENETLACGTGSVASAISAYLKKNTDKTSYLVHAPGGDLQVKFKPSGHESFKDVWLQGPAEFVFSGEI
jgi:diaminopimelate epimerase